MTVSAFGTKPAPARSTEMIRLPSGSSMSATRSPTVGRVVADLELDDLQALLFEREQVHEAVARHLVLDQAQDQVGRGDRRLDPEQLEVLVVARVVDARDDAVAEVLLLGDLADEHVVLVVAGHRDHEVGALDAGALEHPQLGRVAVLRGVLELLLDREVARREDSSSVTSWPFSISSRARLRPTLPAPTMIAYI